MQARLMALLIPMDELGTERICVLTLTSMEVTPAVRLGAHSAAPLILDDHGHLPAIGWVPATIVENQGEHVSDEQVVMLTTIAGLVIFGITLILVGRMGASGNLQRNNAVGLRTKWSMTSDEAWRITHQVSAPGTIGAGMVALAAIPVGLAADWLTSWSGELVWLGALTVGYGLGTVLLVRGYRAAKRAVAALEA